MRAPSPPGNRRPVFSFLSFSRSTSRSTQQPGRRRWHARALWAAGALGAALLLGAANLWPGGAAQAPAPVRVVTTIAALADVAARVGGGDVEVTGLITAQQDPHHYDVRASDVRAVARADLFVKIGQDLEPWAERLVDSAGSKTLRVLDTSAGARLRVLAERGHELDHEHHREHGDADHADHAHELDADHGHDPVHDHEHHDGDVDPHYWLHPENAVHIAFSIARALAELRPELAFRFHERAAAFAAEVREVAASLRHELAQLPDRRVVSASGGFGYLLAAFGLEEVERLEVGHGTSPSARRVAEVAARMKQEALRVIVADYGSADRLVEGLAGETGARVAHLVSLEGAAGGITTYLGMLRHNAAEIIAAFAGGAASGGR